MRGRRVVVVTGMHRSATTFTGRILATVPGTAYLQEPFNWHYGLAGVHTMYPIFPSQSTDGGDDLVELYDRVVALRARYRRWRTNDRPAARAARLLFAGQAGRSQLRARLARPPATTLVIKDPYLSLAVPWLIDHRDVRCVQLLRHPMAIWRSVQRMGWGLDFASVGGPQLDERLSTLGLPDRAKIARATHAERQACLWTLIYGEIVAPGATGDVLVVRHEDLSTTPHDWFERIAVHTGLVLPAKTHAEITSRTEAETVTPEVGHLHEFSRHSASVAHAWTRHDPNEDERAIRAITGPAVERLYGSWRPG